MEINYVLRKKQKRKIMNFFDSPMNRRPEPVLFDYEMKSSFISSEFSDAK